MVFYFETDSGHLLYMGKDKHENEELIKYGFPEDIWFHVSSLSSAHVYLRMKEGEEWDTLPEELVHECCVLVKHNSIEGCKKETVKVVYTPCTNLKKTSDMAVGQVGFYKKKLVKKVKNVPKDKDIVKKLYKTKQEKYPDLAKLRAKKEKQIIKKRKKIANMKRQQKNKEKEEKEAEQQMWDDAKDDFYNEEEMDSNQNGVDFDDFM